MRPSQEEPALLQEGFRGAFYGVLAGCCFTVLATLLGLTDPWGTLAAGSSGGILEFWLTLPDDLRRFVITLAVAAPVSFVVGEVLGVLNGYLVRFGRGRHTHLAGAMGLLVGLLSGFLLPSFLLVGGNNAAIAILVGACSGVASAAHYYQAVSSYETYLERTSLKLNVRYVRLGTP